MKLIINKIFIRNFRSIGDVGEEINLSKRGAVLISGMNGAGKTSIVEAIVWCLFGKLSDGQSPGDNIINWETKKNCIVNIITENGYEICRTRKFDGHSDLLISKNGQPVEGGDSTNANAQLALNGLFSLDFNSFISSLFFGQSSGSFLTLSDSKKKIVIENLFGLSKLTCYAKVAKDRINKCDELHTSLKTKISDIEVSIKSTEEEIDKYRKHSEEFEKQRERSIRNQQEEIDRLTKDRKETIDIDSVKLAWETINKGNEKINQLINKKEDLDLQLKKITDSHAKLTRKKSESENELKLSNQTINSLKKKIEDWQKKEGTTCPTCEQAVVKEFIQSKIESIEKENQKEIERLETEINKHQKDINEIKTALENSSRDHDLTQSKIDNIVENIKKLKKSVESAKTGKMTIAEAQTHNELVNNVDREIQKCKKLIEDENSKTNNYNKLIEDSQIKIDNFKNLKGEFTERCEALAIEASHLTYIYRAHSDKKNLRSFLISGSVPILNNRLSYYFNELNINSDINFNQALQIKSDRWPYSLHSGGEKKRVDLALMCALYDTFTSIYGQKCNILVLDELDKEFDKDGVEEYIRLIIDDLSNRIDTILVISHKDEISYSFPTQIKVKKENELSCLEQ